MSKTPNPPSEPREGAPALEDSFVSFWDIVRRQFFRNKIAVFALYSLFVVIAVAIFAPFIALNVPFVIWSTEGVRWPLFIKLFDGMVFKSGVDIFFNVLLVLLPFWILVSRVVRHSGLDGTPVDKARLIRWSIPTGLLTGFYILLGTQPNSRYFHLLAVGGVGIGLMVWARMAGKGKTARERRHHVGQARNALGVLLGIATLLMVFAWNFTSPSIAYRTKIAELESSEEGSAISPPVFLHPDNRNDDQSYVLENSLHPPSISNRTLLGCDNNGRDVFTRIIYGSRISLTIGIVAVSIYLTIGIILGSIAGYFGGKTDMFIVFVLQVMMCIPGLFLILAIMAFFDERSIFMIMGVIGITSWTGVTRLVRGEFFRQRSIEYVTAAKCLGIPERQIIFGHILKNSVGPVLVSAAFGIAGAVLTESFLAFIGLGDTNAPSWGQILQEGHTHGKWWLLYSPGLAIFYLVTVLNLVGEGLRDALDPKLRT